ncbi:hypothetical protein MG293_005967, partial [Ovis ammon polii]
GSTVTLTMVINKTLLDPEISPGMPPRGDSVPNNGVDLQFVQVQVVFLLAFLMEVTDVIGKVLVIRFLQVFSQSGIFYLILVFTLACYKYPGSCQETMVKLTVLISGDHGLCADDSHDALNHDSNHEILQVSQNEMLSYLQMPTTLLYCRYSDSRQEIKMNLLAVKAVLADVQVSDDVHLPHITASSIHISRILSSGLAAQSVQCLNWNVFLTVTLRIFSEGYET